jgi:fumarate hydratase subunit beta
MDIEIIKEDQSIMMNIKEVRTPLQEMDVDDLAVGDRIVISGEILTGRDAALPRLVKL